jgi:hypothetical protein
MRSCTSPTSWKRLGTLRILTGREVGKRVLRGARGRRLRAVAKVAAKAGEKAAVRVGEKAAAVDVATGGVENDVRAKGRLRLV